MGHTWVFQEVTRVPKKEPALWRAVMHRHHSLRTPKVSGLLALLEDCCAIYASHLIASTEAQRWFYSDLLYLTDSSREYELERRFHEKQNIMIHQRSGPSMQESVQTNEYWQTLICKQPSNDTSVRFLKNRNPSAQRLKNEWIYTLFMIDLILFAVNE